MAAIGGRALAQVQPDGGQQPASAEDQSIAAHPRVMKVWANHFFTRQELAPSARRYIDECPMEGRTGWSIVALPGPRGGRRSSDEPRGPGSLTIDRELTAFVRFIGMLDNGSRPTKLRRPSRQVRFLAQPRKFPRGS